jgi:hypothetical protein
VIIAASGVACSSSETDDNTSDEVRAGGCEVAIVGGGAGGIHTAFRLAPSLGSRVCLFEKEKELGGRIHDISFDDQAGPEAPRVGVGARRVMETQEVLFNLATELGLELEKPPLDADLIDARGVYSFSKDAIAEKAYPTIPTSTVADKDRETILYDTLRASPERANAPSYPDFATYSKHVIGEEQYQFLRDVSRFRADFEYPLDARGYLDYLDEEWDTCCQPSYPKGGMSSFIRAMEAKASQGGVRIFKGTPVTSINKTSDGYSLATSTGTVHANKIVIAVPPVGLDKIGGDVAERIKAQSQYRQIIGVRVVTVTQFWDDAWYKAIKNPAATANAEVWRAWTTEHCLNFIEIPVEPYAAAQNVTRSVYVDSDKCVSYWEDLAKQGTAAVEADLQKGLTALFNNGGVSAPASVTVPKPKKTFIQSWPAAWHWLRAGATITNAQLTDWAVEPLQGEPVALVGEAYNVQRSGWSDAAYKSSIKLLNAKYGQNLAGLRPRSIPFVSLDRGYRGSR